MFTLRLFSLFSCVLLLGGCEMMVPPWHYWSQHKLAHTPVTCSGEADCAAKWQRAAAWVKTNAATPMVTISPTLIKTEDSPYLSTNAGFTVTLDPLGGDEKRLTLHANCSDIFGCIPPLLTLRADFAHYVLTPNAPLKKVK